jgi:ATP synthase subunit 6
VSLITPFEQFEIILLKHYALYDLDFSLTNLSVLLIMITWVIFVVSYSNDTASTYLPNNWQIIFENQYKFVLTMVKEQTGVKGLQYFPLLITVFTLVLFFNICGLIPFSFTASSHVIITFGLALSFFFAWVIIGIKKLQLQFLNVFLPRNMPVWLIPLLVCVELLSFTLRPLSLGIRLFANMLAGHRRRAVFAARGRRPGARWTPQASRTRRTIFRAG